MSYIQTSELINAAIGNAIEAGAKTDEIFAALSVQKEVWNVRLAQAIIQPPQWAPAPEPEADKDAE